MKHKEPALRDSFSIDDVLKKVKKRKKRMKRQKAMEKGKGDNR